MENKKIAILGLIHACADEAMGYIDDGSNSYKLFRLRQDLGLEIVAEYPRIQYQDRVQFVWTMFRMGPVCTFFDNPEEVAELKTGMDLTPWRLYLQRHPAGQFLPKLRF